MYARIDEKARKAALAAGREIGTTVQFSLDKLDEADRAVVARNATTVDSDGKIRCDNYHVNIATRPGALAVVALNAVDDSPAAIVEDLRRQEAKRAAAEAERDAEAKKEAAEYATRVDLARAAPLDDLLHEWYGGLRGGMQWTTRNEDVCRDAGRLEEARAEINRREVERTIRLREQQGATKQKEEAMVAERQAKRDALVAEITLWAAEHGSQRLSRLVSEGIECETVYRDERLAVERGGWEWADLPYREEPRNVPESALDMLDAARASLPEAEQASAKLGYYRVSACDSDECDGGDDCPGDHDGRRYYAVVGIFMDEGIAWSQRVDA